MKNLKKVNGIIELRNKMIESLKVQRVGIITEYTKANEGILCNRLLYAVHNK